MDEYEKKLHSFRKQKRKEKFLNQCKTYLWHRPISSLSSLVSSSENPAETELADSTLVSSVPLLKADDSSAHCIEDDDASEDNDNHILLSSSTEDVTDDVEISCNWIKFTSSALLWICLFSYSVYIEFGAIFFILSCFYAIWTNTRTGPKKRNEISAYSVFNPNCERIEGTFDAKQLESEMLYGGIGGMF